MEIWVDLGGKESHTNQFKSRQSRGSIWGPCGRKAEILPTAPTTPTHELVSFYSGDGIWLLQWRCSSYALIFKIWFSLHYTENEHTLKHKMTFDVVIVDRSGISGKARAISLKTVKNRKGWKILASNNKKQKKTLKTFTLHYGPQP